MSRERPESWEELLPGRNYYRDLVILRCQRRHKRERQDELILTDYDGIISRLTGFPRDLLLVPTRQEWEAAQKSSADLRDAAMLIRRLLRRIPEHRIPEQQAQNWLERKGLQCSVLRADEPAS